LISDQGGVKERDRLNHVLYLKQDNSVVSNIKGYPLKVTIGPLALPSFTDFDRWQEQIFFVNDYPFFRPVIEIYRLFHDQLGKCEG